MSEQNKSPVARLHGGPADGSTLPIKGTQKWPSPWPGYLCLNMSKKRAAVPMHYVLIAAGVYEFGGACLEFDHDNEEHVDRCPDCGSRRVQKPEG